MCPPTHLGWTLPGLYPTIQNRGGHVTLYARLPTVIVFSCPQGSLGTRLVPGLYPTIQNRGGHVTLYTRLPTCHRFFMSSGEPGNEASLNHRSYRLRNRDRKRPITCTITPHCLLTSAIPVAMAVCQSSSSAELQSVPSCLSTSGADQLSKCCSNSRVRCKCSNS